MSDLRKMLADGRAHVMDGAMGTILYDRGVFVNVCYDELNATDPALVYDIHKHYIYAGAEVIETNTFGANPVRLQSYGLDDRTEELNRRAAEIARRAAGGRAAVAGSIGPLGIHLEPLGRTARREARDYFARQVNGLLDGGVRGFVIETFSDPSEAEQALLAVRMRSDLPAIVLFNVGEDLNTASGAPVESAARAMDELGADAIGLNCSVGPAVVLDGLDRIAAVTQKPLVAVPNAGLPRVVGGRKMYLTGPDYFAQYARQLIDAGAVLIGGCCGTTPEHIRRIREEVGALQPKSASVTASRPEPAAPVRRKAKPLARRSALGKRLATGQLAVVAEVLPPREWDTKSLLAECRLLAGAGAAAVAVREERGAMRMNAVAAAERIMADSSIDSDVIVHYICRDRTLADMVSDLLGAAALGIPNLLLLTGDPPTGGPYPDFRSVVSVDPVGLANVVTALNSGTDPAGNSIGKPAGFVAGAKLSPGVRDQARELERWYWKADAGADFAVTPPVFDVGHFLEFLGNTEPKRPVLAGIRPLAGAREAEYLQHEVPGVRVPEAVVRRIRRAEDRGDAPAAGIEFAVETAAALAGKVAGFYVSGAGAGAVAEVVRAVACLRCHPQPAASSTRPSDAVALRTGKLLT